MVGNPDLVGEMPLETVCLSVPSSLECGSHARGRKVALETRCPGKILRTGRRQKAREACWLTLLPFKELSQKLETGHLLSITFGEILLPIREVGKYSFQWPSTLPPPTNRQLAVSGIVPLPPDCSGHELVTGLPL